MDLKQCDICGRISAKQNFYDYSMYVAGKDEPVDQDDCCPACAGWIRASVQQLKRLKQRKAAARPRK